MGLIRCILKHKQSELNLNDVSGRFHIARNFVPPPVSLRPNLAAGSSANRMGGATLISTKAENRRWSFGVHVTGDSEAEVRGGISILDSFLRRGTPSDPVYVHVRGSEDVGFEPLWGQFGSDLRYEVVFGNASASRQYSFGFIREGELPECQVNLQIKPFAVGLQQRLGSAVGGILEDTIGAVDGLSRGVIIPEALAANKFTNPIFGHATYDNGWTLGGAGGVKSENTDEAFLLFGKSSVKLTQDGTANACDFYQSINVGNTNAHVISCYVKKPDGSDPGTTNYRLLYQTARTIDRKISVGNGWYRFEADVTGVNSAVSAGIRIQLSTSETIFPEGFQIEEKAYSTPPCHGDMLGCSWSGTAHASTSVRVAARLRQSWSDIMDVAEGTLRVVWKAGNANTDFAADMFLARGTTNVMSLFWDAANDRWAFYDGTNQVSATPGDSFAVGDIIILHVIWKPGSMKVYKSGSEIATGSTYTPPTAPADYYIGSNNTPASHSNGTFMDFTPFAQAMDATEVSDDAANILEHVEDDRRLSPIPWLWTKDGDDVVDNCDDSAKDNYCVIGGIPGSVQAESEIQMLKAGESLPGIYIAKCQMPYTKFVYPTSQWYAEMQGTALATCSGGEYEETAVTTPTVVETLDPDYPEEFRKDIHFFGRLSSDATEDTYVTPVMYFGPGGDVVSGEQKKIVLIDGWRWYYLGSMYFDYPEFVDDTVKQSRWGLEVDDVDGAVNFRGDFLMALNGELIHVDGDVHATYYLTVSKSFVYRTDSTGALLSLYPTKGHEIELTPEKFNYIWVIMANDLGILTITDTMTFSKVQVRPRWALL